MLKSDNAVVELNAEFQTEDIIIESPNENKISEEINGNNPNFELNDKKTGKDIQNNNEENNVFSDANDDSNSIKSFSSFNSNENDENEDSEDDKYDGYVPLNGYCLLNDEDDEENNDDIEDDEVLEKKKEEAISKNKIVIETSKEHEIPEDDLKVINSIMSKITIPEDSIPKWAKDIPESLWMPKIVKK